MSERHALYVIGEPGSGKSTLVERLTDGYRFEARAEPFAHRFYPEAGVHEIGARRESFGGTDALSMSVITTVERWIIDTAPAAVLAEGDRLANQRFFDFLIEHGYQLRIARLRVRWETGARRRRARGSEQDEKWVRGRRTKVDRLGALYPERTVNLPHEDGGTRASLRQLAKRSPVAAAFDPR